MKVCIDCNRNLSISQYYKNKKMKDGHLNSCKDCRREIDRKYKNINRDKLYKQNKDWKLRNKDIVNSYMKQYRITNKDRIYELKLLWQENNRERYLATKNSVNAQRRANKKCAFVKWADKSKIKELYILAQNLTLLTGVLHHVDHKIPLVNSKVCGLHCEDNLRVIPYYENLKKSNKLIEDIV